MRKAEEFKNIAELGFRKITAGYLLKWFGSLDRIIFEGRRAAYLKSYEYEFIDADGKEKCLSHKTTVELIEVMEDNKLVRNDLDIIFRIGRFYSSMGHFGYVASFTDFKVACDRKCSELSYAEANGRYENIETPTPRQLAELRAAIAARLSPEECIVIMSELSGHYNVKDPDIDRTLARYLGLRDDEMVGKTRHSATMKLMGLYGDNPLPSFPIPDGELMPTFHDKTPA